MTTLIFIHSTGVRRSQYEASFERIQKRLAAERPDLKVAPCCWGEVLGTKLQRKAHQQGISWLGGFQATAEPQNPADQGETSDVQIR